MKKYLIAAAVMAVMTACDSTYEFGLIDDNVQAGEKIDPDKITSPAFLIDEYGDTIQLVSITTANTSKETAISYTDLGLPIQIGDWQLVFEDGEIRQIAGGIIKEEWKVAIDKDNGLITALSRSIDDDAGVDEDGVETGAEKWVYQFRYKSRHLTGYTLNVSQTFSKGAQSVTAVMEYDFNLTWDGNTLTDVNCQYNRFDGVDRTTGSLSLVIENGEASGYIFTAVPANEAMIMGSFSQLVYGGYFGRWSDTDILSLDCITEGIESPYSWETVEYQYSGFMGACLNGVKATYYSVKGSATNEWTYKYRNYWF